MYSASTMARSGSPPRAVGRFGHRSRARRRRTDIIVAQNKDLGLAIDFETATAHWHGERIDYDHALMVTMASWDSGDTRPEAGPGGGRLESVVDSFEPNGLVPVHQSSAGGKKFKPNREFRSA